ncbi:hypothetical protein LC087_05725 [Bacillus carboniphilus]|uniref:Uncharacterized protein n=1 Tax=Bacillus carboniphilus TaxID=86663 RepID=A0ABY9JW86_9BACI|nr:hypothetical protein [Bacillus carboniphilus]WLR43645.1 hypothetical protein LC087_05725 [Bacillus carboniphilus]
MNPLEEIWNKFILIIQENKNISDVNIKNITGTPFLYINSYANKQTILQIINEASQKSMYKKKVTKQTTFVRHQDGLYVFRHRFFVPQEKMFCCGNECVDCVRYKRRR